MLTEMTNVVGSAFLGVTLGCARCHDHKFDPIRQSDYYRMQAFFAAAQDKDVAARHARGTGRLEGEGRADRRSRSKKLKASMQEGATPDKRQATAQARWKSWRRRCRSRCRPSTA